MLGGIWEGRGAIRAIVCEPRRVQFLSQLDYRRVDDFRQFQSDLGSANTNTSEFKYTTQYSNRSEYAHIWTFARFRTRICPRLNRYSSILEQI